MNKKRIAGGVIAGVVLVALLFAWQLGLFSSEPEEANLADAIAAESGQDAADSSDSDDTSSGSAADDNAADDNAADDNAADDNTADDNTADDNTADEDTADSAASDPGLPCSVSITNAPSADGEISSATDMAGRWEIGASEGTFAGYRINEILSGIDFEAVGRTAEVSGGNLEIEESKNDEFTVTSVEVAVDMTGLASDSRIRDSQMKSQALETAQFPVACFELTEPITLAGVAVEPEQFTIVATGDLTIHDVTRTEQIELQATTSGGLLFIVGSIELALVDFDIDTPEAPAVAGVGETAIMEFSLVLGR